MSLLEDVPIRNSMSFAVLLFFLWSDHSLAQAQGQCAQKSEFKAVDFQNEFGPQRYQGGVGWCFAYAGADLLTHYLFQQGEISGFSEAEIPSATAMALMSVAENDSDNVVNAVAMLKIANDYNIQIKEWELEKAKVLGYLKFLKKMRINAWGEKLERILDEIRLNEIAFGRLRQNLYFAKKELERIENEFPNQYGNALERGGMAAYAAVRMANNGLCSESKVQSSFLDTHALLPLGLVDERGRANKLKILSRLVQFVGPQDTEAIRVIFPSADEDMISTYRELVSPERLPFAILNKVCEAKPVKKMPKVKYFSVVEEKKPKKEEMDQMFQIIDEQVDNRNALVLSVDGDIFDMAGKPFTFETGHAVLIVGKRFNCEFDEPEYIIRNSWGPRACEKYLPDFRRHNNYAKQMSEAIEKRIGNCQEACSLEGGDEMEDLRRCIETCRRKEDANFIKVNRPPYTCENSNYVVRKSHLQKASRAVRHLEPAN